MNEPVKVDWVWVNLEDGTNVTRYDVLWARLVSLLDGDLLLQHDPDENDSRVLLAVQEVTEMSGARWEKLNHAARAPYIEKAIAAHLAKQQPAKKTSTKAASVNERMLAMIEKDPALVNLSAEKWAVKVGKSAPAVKQTATWKNIIMKQRELQKKARAERGK